MTGYIRDPSTWNAVKTVQVLSYDLPLVCQKGETGTAEVLGALSNYQRFVFSLEGNNAIWVISGVSSINNGVTTLQLEDGTAVSEEFFHEFYNVDILNAYAFPAQYMRQVGSMWAPLYAIANDRYQAWQRRVKYADGKELAYWARLQAFSGGSYWGPDFLLLNNYFSNLLSGVDYSGALLEGTDDVGSGYIVSIRELLRSVQFAGIDVKYTIEPYVQETISFEPAQGDGLKYEDTIYKIIARFADSLDLEIDDTAPVYWESVTAPTPGGTAGTYTVNPYNVKILNKKVTDVIVHDDRTDLQLSFGSRVDTSIAIPIYFNDGHSNVISENYDEKEIVSKIVVFQKDGLNSYDLFLSTDGTISGYSETQALGTTSYILSDEASLTFAKAKELATEQFLANPYSTDHSVEFFSDKEFKAGTPVRLMLDRGVLDTVISKVSIVSSDSRYKYQCGGIPASVVDKLQTFKWSYGRRTPISVKAGSMFIEN